MGGQERFDGVRAALILALALGVATMALAAVPGDPFRLGQVNRINDALTTLIGGRSGPMLVVDNDSTAANARALGLRVDRTGLPWPSTPTRGWPT